MEPLFKIKVKQAFSKVREDIDFIKAELGEFKALIENLINKLSSYEKNEKPSETNNLGLKTDIPKNDSNSSMGNKGVYAFSHSVSHSPFTHLNTHSLSQTLKSPDLSLTSIQNNQISQKLDPLQSLQTLTNKEFLVFLTIYRLEKEIPRITYEGLAKHLSLTSGCIRSYITSLIRKRVPIIKSKLNNKLIILSIEPSFRSLTSEQKLINLYYQNDTSQSTLL